jgi:hypothetical protein
LDVPSSYLLELGQAAEAFAGLCVYTLAAVLIHEAGHAAAGLLFGFEIRAVRVGPADLKRQNKWIWGLNKERWDSGFVMVQFRNLPGPLAGLRCFAFILGGPAANLCLALVLASFSSGSTLFGRGCGYLMLVCILLGVTNLVPFRSKLGLSDGAKLLSILFRPKWRGDFVFRLSLKARVAEIIALSRNHKFEQAIEEVDELKARFSQLAGVNPEATLNLQRMRDAFERALLEASAPKTAPQTSQG